MEGWIKTYRELIDHWVWQNDKYLKCWLWFLLHANHSECKILIGSEFMEIKRGEFITSISKICEATGMTMQVTRTFLSLLEKDKMINKQTTSKLTKISICKYEYYQGEQQINNKRYNKQITSSQQARNKPATINKNENNDLKNENNIIPPSLEIVKLYCFERKNNVDPVKWFDFYESKGWMIGKNKMKDWKAAIRTWEKTNESEIKKPQSIIVSNGQEYK
ncbi:MAG: hypothetical protein WC998_04835 [Candidatus Paceibacterota bacterium]|jgi:hypothetical protein